VVIASGACNIANIPALSPAVPCSISTFTPITYRNTAQLADGGVLVVGASATGIQLTDEIHRSGQAVTLSVGEHVRVPRTYRGKDIQWWMDAAGLLDERYDQIDDIVRARKLPSLQLVGSPGRTTLDLNALSGIGIKLVGRLVGIRDGKAQFSGSLKNQSALADLKWFGSLIRSMNGQPPTEPIGSSRRRTVSNRQGSTMRHHSKWTLRTEGLRRSVGNRLSTRHVMAPHPSLRP
jgi:putative flavoprotein involved in K+ transport